MSAVSPARVKPAEQRMSREKVAIVAALGRESHVGREILERRLTCGRAVRVALWRDSDYSAVQAQM